VRAVVQRVDGARVLVDGEAVGEISGVGLCALVAATYGDTVLSAAALAHKLWHLRILADKEGRMNRSCAELGAPLLVISQFTLYGDTARGRRPSFVAALPGPEAEPLIEQVVDALRHEGAAVSTGRFGAHMRLELTNDGPVTLIVET
jgi:D-tyrosyl-tRNA(Tyr) deacylase